MLYATVPLPGTVRPPRTSRTQPDQHMACMPSALESVPTRSDAISVPRRPPLSTRRCDPRHDLIDHWRANEIECCKWQHSQWHDGRCTNAYTVTERISTKPACRSATGGSHRSQHARVTPMRCTRYQQAFSLESNRVISKDLGGAYAGEGNKIGQEPRSSVRREMEPANRARVDSNPRREGCVQAFGRVGGA
jgi:hypothetical protein